MNDITADDAPITFPTKEERDALILEFQRLAARLTRAGLISRASSSRLMRSMNQERRQAEDKRHAFPELVLAILLAILLRHRGLAEICNEGVQMLLGCFGRRPVGVGTFDLTPVIFFIVMNLLYSLAVALLRALLQWMPWT